MGLWNTLKEKGFIDTERKTSPASLPLDTRKCHKCGCQEMQASGAFYGGWSHQETVFDYQCPNCGQIVTLESHHSFHGSILLFFLLLELIIFFLDDFPNYITYGLWSSFFIGLFLWLNADNWFFYPVVKKD